MVSALGAFRVVLHVLVALILLVSISLAFSAIMTTGWQVFADTGTDEIHQHGLWFDYTYAKTHAAGTTGPEWQWRRKFGDSVKGDEEHRWKPYQYGTLILLSVATLFALIALPLSYMAPFFVSVAVTFVVVLVFPLVLGAAAVIWFFTTASLPENNHVNTEYRIHVDVSYSFYLAAGAAAGYALALLVGIGAAIIDILMAKRGERPSFRESYFRVSTKNTRQQQYNTSV